MIPPLVAELAAGGELHAVPLDPLHFLVLAGGAEDGVHLGVGAPLRPTANLLGQVVQLAPEDLGRADPTHRRAGEEQPPVAEVRHRLPEPPELPERLQIAQTGLPEGSLGKKLLRRGPQRLLGASEGLLHPHVVQLRSGVRQDAVGELVEGAPLLWS